MYYQHMNRHVRKRVGGFHSAPLLLNSVDFAEFEEIQRTGDWTRASKRLGDAARDLVHAGAKAIVLCTNTFHAVADDIRKAAGVEMIHIVDVTAENIKERQLKKVILLGTRPTMEKDFFRKRLEEHGLGVVIPEKAGRDEVNRVIFEELVQGKIMPSSRAAYKQIIDELVRKEGAQGVVAGCTEIELLIKEDDIGLPIFDTARIHAEKAVDWAIEHGKLDQPKAKL